MSKNPAPDLTGLRTKLVSRASANLSGLRTKFIRSVRPSASKRIRFVASDGRVYTAPANKKAEVLKIDPGAKFDE